MKCPAENAEDSEFPIDEAGCWYCALLILGVSVSYAPPLLLNVLLQFYLIFFLGRPFLFVLFFFHSNIYISHHDLVLEEDSDRQRSAQARISCRGHLG